MRNNTVKYRMSKDNCSREGGKTRRITLKILSGSPSSRQFIFYLLVSTLLACNNSSNKPDVSDIKMDVTIERFDKAFFSIDTTNIEASLKSLHTKYPDFYEVYSRFMTPIDFMMGQQGMDEEKAVLTYYRNIKPLYDQVQKKYADLGSLQNDLQKSLKYVKYYFPSFKKAAVFTSVENFNPDDPLEVYGTAFYHDTLIISLQMFLGQDFAGYDPSQYPEYLRRRFEAPFIVPNSMRMVAASIYADTVETNSLIETMVERGKQWFLMKKFLPDTPDSLITGFSGLQSEFVDKNEGNLWARFLENTPDPYTVNQERLKNYLGEGPFTEDMPHDNNGNGTPGNIGQWIGWKIVEKFAANNSKLSLQEVLNTPAKKIFQEAKYKPK